MHLTMGYPQFHYRWNWQLESSPEALWPLVSDTNRFNCDTGVPAVQQDQEDARNGRRRLRLKRFGVGIEWEEEPFEWLRPYRFGVVRRYTGGPVAEMRIQAELVPQSEGHTKLHYDVSARPRNPLGLLAIPIQIGVLSRGRFGAAFRHYDQLAAQGKSVLDHPAAGKVELASGGSERLTRFRDTLLQQGADPAIVSRLVETIEHGDDIVVARMRPYALADVWGLPRRQVLETFLWATRVGLLNFRWDVVCPFCRGAKETTESLGEMDSGVHCNSCNIDFTANFEQLVELTFRPNPAVREVDVGEFCVGGPQVTPHIVAQQLLGPGAKRTLLPPLEPGRYRIRTLGLPGGQYLVGDPDGPAEITIRATSAGWAEERRIGLHPTLRLENATDAEQLFIFERMAWTDQSATAVEVTTLQVFRDLFASEALRPGEKLSVGSLVILFTDLRGSTRLYREIGDAPAFGRVMSHFDVLRDAIADEGGALIKTIGDAVMAAFNRPAPAVRAILQAQQVLANPTDGMVPLGLKSGIHMGPSIAVTLNQRLDYFGSTVNAAARLEGLSHGNDIVISGAVRSDPEVAALLEEGSFIVEPIEASLKGFEEERFELWRVEPSPTSRLRSEPGMERAEASA